MAIEIKNYDQTVLATVPDRIMDITSSSLHLPGTGYQDYGGPILSDLVWIMQHFSRETAPDLPVKGQIWYDTTGNLLKLFNGTQWVACGSILSGPLSPINPVVGTFWWNTTDSSLHSYDGAQWLRIGPPALDMWQANMENAPYRDNVRRLGNITNRFSTVYSVNLDVTQNSNLSVITADQTTTSQLTVKNNSNLANVYVMGNITALNSQVRGNLTVLSGSAFYGPMSIANKLSVTALAIFSGAVGIGTAPGTGYSLDVNGFVRTGGILSVEATGPAYQFLKNTTSTTNNKSWSRSVSATGKILSEYLADDSNSIATYWLQVGRNELSVTNVAIYTGTNSVQMILGDNGDVYIPRGGIKFQDGTFQNTAGDQSKSTNGYQVLPNGVIMQWGTGTIFASTSVNVVLPRPFTNANYSITVSDRNASNWGGSFPYLPTIYGTDNTTLTAFDVFGVQWDGSNWSAGTLEFKWIAMGY